MEKILDDVETRVRAAKLFDQYGALLKDNARGIFEEYESRLQLVSRREEAEILISELEKISLKSNDKALKKIAVKLESLV